MCCTPVYREMRAVRTECIPMVTLAPAARIPSPCGLEAELRHNRAVVYRRCADFAIITRLANDNLRNANVFDVSELQRLLVGHDYDQLAWVDRVHVQILQGRLRLTAIWIFRIREVAGNNDDIHVVARRVADLCTTGDRYIKRG